MTRTFTHPNGIGGWTRENGRWTHYCRDCGKENTKQGGARCGDCYALQIAKNRIADHKARCRSAQRIADAAEKRQGRPQLLDTWRFVSLSALSRHGSALLDSITDCRPSPAEALMLKEEAL